MKELEASPSCCCGVRSTSGTNTLVLLHHHLKALRLPTVGADSLGGETRRLAVDEVLSLGAAVPRGTAATPPAPKPVAPPRTL